MPKGGDPTQISNELDKVKSMSKELCSTEASTAIGSKLDYVKDGLKSSKSKLSQVDGNIVRTELRVLQNATNASCGTKKDEMTRSINNILKVTLGELADDTAAKAEAAKKAAAEAKAAADAKSAADAKAAAAAKAAADIKAAAAAKAAAEAKAAAAAKAAADAQAAAEAKAKADKRAQIEKNVAEARAKQASEAAAAKANADAEASAKLEAARKQRATSPGIVFKNQKNINMLNKLGIKTNSSDIYDAKQKLSEINNKFKDNTVANLRKSANDRVLVDVNTTDFAQSGNTKIEFEHNKQQRKISALELKPEKLDPKEHIYQYGGWKAKYLKYKAKYMQLKEELNL